MVKEYTGRYKGFQIRDVVYLGEPPTDIPPTFDVVKWDNNGSINEYCYTVGKLEYNAKEPCFEFKSCGLRWLKAHPDEDVENWIIKWCYYKLQELYED